MKQKKPESNVVRLHPEPAITSWRAETHGGETEGFVVTVNVHHRLTEKSKEAARVRFIFFLDTKHVGKKSVTHQLELLSVEGAEGLSEKQVGALRREAKDAVNDYHAKYKRNPR